MLDGRFTPGTDSLGTPGLTGCFFYVRATDISLPRGGSGSSSGPLPQWREGGVLYGDDDWRGFVCSQYVT